MNNIRKAFSNASFCAEFRTAETSDGTIAFTPLESQLLFVFTDNPHRVLSRDQLLDKVAGIGSESSDRSIDVAVYVASSEMTPKTRNSSRPVMGKATSGSPGGL